MPRCDVIFYQEDDKTVPALDWLREMGRRDHRIVEKLQARIERLAETGHALRRPECDLLRDGIYELRARPGSTNYRLLYFFYGRTAAILAQGLTKETEVPNAEIERAMERKRRFEQDPEKHTYDVEEADEHNEEHPERR